MKTITTYYFLDGELRDIKKIEYSLAGFKRRMSRFLRDYLRKKAKKFGLLHGGDKVDLIKRMYNDPRPYKINARV